MSMTSTRTGYTAPMACTPGPLDSPDTSVNSSFENDDDEGPPWDCDGDFGLEIESEDEEDGEASD